MMRPEMALAQMREAYSVACGVKGRSHARVPLHLLITWADSLAVCLDDRDWFARITHGGNKMSSHDPTTHPSGPHAEAVPSPGRGDPQRVARAPSDGEATRDLASRERVVHQPHRERIETHEREPHREPPAAELPRLRATRRPRQQAACDEQGRSSGHA